MTDEQVVGIGGQSLGAISNNGKSDFVTSWDGSVITIPAGKAVQMPTHIIDHILGSEALLNSTHGNASAGEYTRLHKRWKDTTANLSRGSIKKTSAKAAEDS